jgi:GntR family transcriptional regulator
MPIHAQVAAEIRRVIIEGEIAESERMPPAVSLAKVLNVNKNTVIRALHDLRDEGMLDFTRGRGIRVVGTPQRGALLEKIDEVVELSKRYGYAIDDVISLIVERRPTTRGAYSSNGHEELEHSNKKCLVARSGEFS